MNYDLVDYMMTFVRIGESNRPPQVNEFAKTYMPTGDEEAAAEGSGKNIVVPAGDGSHQNNNLAR